MRAESGRARWRLLGLDGLYHWVSGNAARTHERGVLVVSLHVVDADVARERELAHMAGSDGLTGLSNRRELLSQLGRTLRKRRTGQRNGVLFCDIDDLKEINDTSGHAAGDLVIAAVGQRIQTVVRRDDICSRFGGDEFVVVLVGVHSLDEVVEIAGKVRQAVVEPIPVSDSEVISPSVSIGATLAHDDESPTAVIDRADRAMYQAKRAGRNAVFAAE